jgi:hypothetical protein
MKNNRQSAHASHSTDLGLPDQPGLAMVPEIRRRGITTRVAVWMASTEARLLAQPAAAAGADAVFNKPSEGGEAARVDQRPVVWRRRSPSTESSP